MQFFPVVDFQHWVAAIFLGLIFLILVYLGFGSHARRVEGKLPEGKNIFGHGEKNPPAPLLIIVYAGVIVFAVAYLIIIGIRGGPF